ncbi:hypothetical protein LTR56_012308 [Elasticomyces elasticus]|nr:hypothetical protein LTR56_012308 [Elasticomyces elasticus]KAK3641264.1 hypothetical protein LTR22_016632 [Elasticomyces elasticus]KAK4922593.1 hypothetical protein LTR49_010120 [Elasticomyces elasticus]KAK5760766.1 hypothetical protein LTS12_009124 [Elasticomyces elasticus]
MTISPWRGTASAVLVYLPRGPHLPGGNGLDSTILVQLLAQKLPCHVVQINYRLGNLHMYPAPVHDVLKGYDWIKEHLLPKRSISRVGRSETVGRVAVCGELIGGGLAAMLALTECRVGQPGIVAAALSSPLVDWVDFQHVLSKPAESDAMIAPLSDLRKSLFRKPEHYFDPFASPMLFLRSAGHTVPPAPPDVPTNDMDYLISLNRQDSVMIPKPSLEEESTPLKRTATRYPTPALGLRLPAFHLNAGQKSPILYGQAEEFTRRLRQAHVRQAGQVDFGRKVLTEDEIDEMNESDKQEVAQREMEAREKVELDVSHDSGLWDDSVAGKARVAKVGQWLRKVLQ